MNILSTLITDRTQADVNRADELEEKGFSEFTESEKAEWMAGMKGYYNATDLNRVGKAVLYLKDRLDTEYADLDKYRELLEVAYDDSVDLPYRPENIHVNPKTDYTASDVPTKTGAEQYIADIKTIRYALPIVAPSIPDTLDDLDYVDANNIENTLETVDNALTIESSKLKHTLERTRESFRRSGQFTFWSGYLSLPAAESDLGRTWSELDAMETTWANWQVADWFLLLYGNLQSKGELE